MNLNWAEDHLPPREATIEFAQRSLKQDLMDREKPRMFSLRILKLYCLLKV